jgi:hypothetical protein
MNQNIIILIVIVIICSSCIALSVFGGVGGYFFMPGSTTTTIAPTTYSSGYSGSSGSGSSGSGSSGSGSGGCEFDALKYADMYADLKAAFGTDAAKLKSHYDTSGKAEGRSPCGDKSKFCKHEDSGWSIPPRNVYPGETLTKGNTTAVCQADGSFKFTEKTASPSSCVFDAAKYEAMYPDLKAAFKGNKDQLKNHYDTYGKAEGRSPCGYNCDFDAAKYEAMYPDLKAAFKGNKDQLKNHYDTYGKAEGRSPCGSCEFDAFKYADLYPDLKAAFNGDKDKLKNHYDTSGKAEGRSPCGNKYIFCKHEDSGWSIPPRNVYPGEKLTKGNSTAVCQADGNFKFN